MNAERELNWKINEALKEAPGFELKKDFSEKLIKKIQMQEAKSEWKTFWLFAGAIFGFILLSGLSLVVLLEVDGAKYLNVGVWCIVSALTIGIIQLLDSRFIKSRISGVR